MKNFIKTALIAGAMVLGATSVAKADQAEANFSTNIASYCTVGQQTPGVMHISGLEVSTDSPAIMMIHNNEPNAYKISAVDAGDFVTKPNAYTGTAALTTSMAVAGENNGTVASGAEMNLVNAGIDQVSVSVAGSINQPAVTGNYEAASVVSCVAQ